MDTTYAILDDKGIIVNVIVAKKDDTEILNNLVNTHKAASYKEIDLEIYNARVGFLFWNGTEWGKVTQ